MKKLVSAILASVIALSMAACSQGNQEADTSAVTAGTSDATVAETTTAVPETTTVPATTTAALETTTASPETTTKAPETTAAGEIEIPDDGLLGIKKAVKAPAIDGVIDENEYTNYFPFDRSETMWSESDSDAGKYGIALYMSWDENYLYTAVTVKATRPRTFDNQTPSDTDRPYIYDRRNVMSAIVTGNPLDEMYYPPDGGENWGWGEAHNSGLGNEWTISAQPDGTNVNGDHFGFVSNDADFEYSVTISDNGIEVYEQAIPWIALSGIDEFTPAVGKEIGFAFCATCEEVDLETEYTVYGTFGGGIINGKNFSNYVPMRLVN